MVLSSNPAAATSRRNFGNSVYPVSFGGAIKAVGPFYLVPVTDARGSKRSYQSALEMCNLPWTPHSSLEKDNSQTLNHSLTRAVLAQGWAVWSIHKLVLNLRSKNCKIHAVQSSEDDMIEHTF